MNIKKYLKERNISIRTMSNITAIPYSTLSDIVNEKVKLEDCQFKTLKKIAVFMNISIDDLVYEYEDFQTFRNSLHHMIVRTDELDLILYIIESKKIDYYVLHEDYIKALYLLSVLDYFSRINDISLCKNYSSLRTKKLNKPFLVNNIPVEDVNKCIDEFVAHNIFEGDLYDAV